MNDRINVHARKEEQMKAIHTTADTTDRTSRLSLLWIFVMFNFTYGDILTLYFNNALQKKEWTLFQSGYVGSVHITQGFVLLGAVLLESAIAMVLLSRLLPYRANRWANIIVGVIQIVANVQALTGSLYRNLFFELFTGIELVCLVIIIWYAWTWRRPEGVVLTERERPRVDEVG
jgi:uncharacterized membrane protein HdeD (DUF308 family)